PGMNVRRPAGNVAVPGRTESDPAATRKRDTRRTRSSWAKTARFKTVAAHPTKSRATHRMTTLAADGTNTQTSGETPSSDATRSGAFVAVPRRNASGARVGSR